MKINGKGLFYVLLVIILISNSFNANAQFNQCVDSSIISRNYICDTTYRPVCGCDNKTYRNLCEAYYHNGIITYTDRICEDIAIVYFRPVPVINEVDYSIYLREASDAYIYIYDVFGKVYYFRPFQNVLGAAETVDLTSLPYGVYLFVGIANGHFAVRKFLKLPKS